MRKAGKTRGNATKTHKAKFAGGKPDNKLSKNYGDKMNTKERSYLRGKANALKPLVYLGKDGITDNFLEEVRTALFHNELIKIAVMKNAPEDAKSSAESVAQATGSEVVQVLGSKITLFKETDKEGFEHLLDKM